MRLCTKNRTGTVEDTGHQLLAPTAHERTCARAYIDRIYNSPNPRKLSSVYTTAPFYSLSHPFQGCATFLRSNMVPPPYFQQTENSHPLYLPPTSQHTCNTAPVLTFLSSLNRRVFPLHTLWISPKAPLVKIVPLTKSSSDLFPLIPTSNKEFASSLSAHHLKHSLFLQVSCLRETVEEMQSEWLGLDMQNLNTDAIPFYCKALGRLFTELWFFICKMVFHL